MNYIGSKSSLLDFIWDTVCDVTGCTDGNGMVFGDLFAGTCSVGGFFSTEGVQGDSE